MPAQPPKALHSARLLSREWFLYFRIPGLHVITTPLTARSLGFSCKNGEAEAAFVLAMAVDRHPDTKIRTLAASTLQETTHSNCIDAAWRAWFETRGAALQSILVYKAVPAQAPPFLRLYSQLLLGNISALAETRPNLVDNLLAACEDTDQRLAAWARQSIVLLKKQDTIDRICQDWAEKRQAWLAEKIIAAGFTARQPVEVLVLTALKTNQLDALLNANREVIAPLVTSAQDADEELRDRAAFCLSSLRTPDAINELVRVWAENRDPALGRLVHDCAYLAQNPAGLRLLSALKCGHRDVAQNITPEQLGFCLECLNDADPDISQTARLALSSLANADTVDALCRLALDDETGPLRKIALSAGYAPQKSEERALFFFLTQQWDAYERLDFDRRLMCAVYETGSDSLRRRIAQTVRSAGRADFLPILSGINSRLCATDTSDDEIQSLIQILIEHREWGQLWELCGQVALPTSKEIIGALKSSGWRPKDEQNAGLFDTLVDLSAQPMVLGGTDLFSILPPALPRATLRVQGRVNSVTFSPRDDNLAMGTGAARVILWNLQEGKVKNTYRGFNHSVGKVAFSPGGLLLAAERTNSKAECGIFRCQGQNLQPVGAHSGSITHLEFMDENTFISTAKDGQMVLWDLPGQKHKAKRKLPDWARTLCISPLRDRIVTLDDQLSVYSYPKLNPIPTVFKVGSSGYRKGVSSSCVFSPDGSSVLSGQHNGQVVVYEQIFSGEPLQPKAVIHHNGPVCALLFHPQRPILISASTDRKILFSNWTDRSALGIVNVPGSEERLTTAQVSPDGYFLATGDANSTFILWDLRVLDIPQILSRPLAGFTPTDLAEINSLLNIGSIPPTVRNALQYIQSVVQQRLLFDIQLVEMPNIQAGEFDVMIDSTD